MVDDQASQNLHDIDLADLKDGDAFLVKLPISLKTHLQNMADEKESNDRKKRENAEEEPEVDRDGNVIDPSIQGPKLTAADLLMDIGEVIFK